MASGAHFYFESALSGLNPEQVSAVSAWAEARQKLIAQLRVVALRAPAGTIRLIPARLWFVPAPWAFGRLQALYSRGHGDLRQVEYKDVMRLDPAAAAKAYRRALAATFAQFAVLDP